MSHLAGGVFLPVGPAEDGEWHALAGEAARRNAQTIASFLDALAEDSDDAGEVSPAEARELLRCVDLQLSLLAKARAKLCDVAAREAPAG